jgi:hypothetical protein
MRKTHPIFLLCLTLFNHFSSNCQPKTKIRELFYNLPINSSRKEIIEKINNDGHFKKTSQEDTSYVSLAGENYKGKIQEIYLPEKYNRPDSAYISIEYGFGMFKQNKEYKKKGTSLTYMKINYFFPSKQSAETFFRYLWNDIRENSKDSADVEIGYKKNKDFLYGKELKLSKKSYLPIISVLRNDYSFSIMLEYERKGD